MNYDFANHKVISYVGLFVLTLLFGCQRIGDIPSPSEITKEQRTQLGEAFRKVILSDTSFLKIIPKENYSTSYDFVQNIYSQAYYLMRDDWNAPNGDQWDTGRTWEVHIIDSVEKQAFCLPGGDLLISNSLLKSFDFEYELYYIMTFEATLMDNRYLLNRLISYANNSADLLKIIEDDISTSGISIQDLVNYFLIEMNYSEDGIVKTIDDDTNRQICESSFYDRLAIQSIMLKLDGEDSWLKTRPPYSNRINYLLNMRLDNSLSCGDKKWSRKLTDYNDYISLLP